METTQRNLKTPTRIILIVLACLLLVLATALLVFRLVMRLPVSDYYNASERMFRIPGLDTAFVPQGFSHDEENGRYLVSGYMNDGSPSPVYVIDAESGEIAAHVMLMKEDGEAYTGHSGGIAQYGDNVYIAGSKSIYVYSYSDIMNAERGASVRRCGVFSLKGEGDDYIGSAYVTVSGERLIVGAFRYEPKYTYPDSHKITTSAGDEHGALAIEFKLDKNAEFGINPTPVRLYSMRDKVQGVCLDDGKFYLSTSYGLAHSYIFVYNEDMLRMEGEMSVLGETLPVYSLDSHSLCAEYKIAPMSEEIFMKDGCLYVMSESASKKYIFGNLIGGEWCYATDLGKMK